MFPHSVLDMLVEKEFPMKTELVNGKVRIIGEVVASNEMELEFLQYKLVIFAKFEVDECVELEDEEFKNYENAKRKTKCEIWFYHHEDSYNPEKIEIEDGLLSVFFSIKIETLLSNSLNEHSVQDLFDYVLGGSCLIVTAESGEYEPLDEPQVGIDE